MGAPTYDFAKFPQKLHEIERIWTPWGVPRVTAARNRKGGLSDRDPPGQRPPLDRDPSPWTETPMLDRDPYPG